MASIEIWRVSLAPGTCRVGNCRSLLSGAERARADRYHRDIDRDGFTVTRGALRTILGRLLDVPAAELGFHYGRTGRPSLEAPWYSDRLSFNVSHSYKLALIALSDGPTVGVDVEFMANNHPLLELAQRFFSPGESRALSNLPEQARTAAFYRCWTLKEAYLKAIGTGLSKALDSFDVTVEDAGSAGLLVDRDAPQAPKQWSLQPLQVPEGYRAAVAVAAPVIRCRYREFELL